jgi:hypothetical protein
MPVIIDKLEMLERIANVRRYTRNGEMMAICDTLEHVLIHGHSVERSKPDVERSAVDCPACAKVRAKSNERKIRYRGKLRADSVKAQ